MFSIQVFSKKVANLKSEKESGEGGGDDHST